MPKWAAFFCTPFSVDWDLEMYISHIFLVSAHPTTDVEIKNHNVFHAIIVLVVVLDMIIIAVAKIGK